MITRSRLVLAILVALVLTGLGFCVARGPGPKQGKISTGPKAEPTPIPGAEQTSIRDLSRLAGVDARITGNGRNEIRILAKSREPQNHVVRVSAGTIFQTTDGSSRVVVLRDGIVNLPARGVGEEIFSSAALSSRNLLFNGLPFVVSRLGTGDLTALFQHLRNHPEYSAASVQVAILAIMENLPLSAFSEFPLVSGAPLTGVGTDPYRTSVENIIAALQLLKDSGYPIDRIALSVDPQLVVEAMIEPLARPAAMKFYGISSDKEWLFWREMLTKGPESMRHYALHGVGRFFPDVALDMLPKWVDDTELGMAYRTAAIYGLAETRRPEAIAILDQLAFKYRFESAISEKIQVSTRFLQRNLAPPSRRDAEVPYRLTEIAPRPLEGTSGKP